MRGLFNYDSPLMQSIMKVGDIVILNFLFLLFSIPVFTIGAAQAGLYTGFRVILDPDDDSSCTAAFIRGFKSGFSVITPVWLILTLAVGAIAYFCFMSYVVEKSGGFASTFIVAAVLIIFVILQTLSPMLHSRFSYKRRQLLRNTFYFMFANPLRSFLIAILMWMPIILFLLDIYLFAKLAVLILVVWYGIAGLLSVILMRKPFAILEEQFQKIHDDNGDPTLPTDKPNTEEATE